MMWARVSSWSCFCWLYRAPTILVAKKSPSHLLYCWKRVFAMASILSWQNSVSLCSTSFWTPRPYLPVILGMSWLPNFAFQSPMMNKTSFFGVPEGVVGLHRAGQLQLLQHQWLGHRLGLLWCWMTCLENKSITFVVFEFVLKCCILNSCWLEGLLHFF